MRFNMIVIYFGVIMTCFIFTRLLDIAMHKDKSRAVRIVAVLSLIVTVLAAQGVLVLTRLGPPG